MTLSQKDLDVALAGVTKLAGGLEEAYALIGVSSDRLELYRPKAWSYSKLSRASWPGSEGLSKPASPPRRATRVLLQVG